MFTGLVEEIGQILSVQPLESGRKIRIAATKVVEDIKTDDSIAVNGVCLTAEQVAKTAFEAVAVAETLRRSTLGGLKKGDPVNLERALRLDDRLGGHLVQGHVDGVGKILTIHQQGVGFEIELNIPANLTRYLIEKGSITVNGVSLTIADIRGQRIRIAVIPHTWKNTTFASCRSGDSVNIEVDLIGKYVERMITPQSRLSEDSLRDMGY